MRDQGENANLICIQTYKHHSQGRGYQVVESTWEAVKTKRSNPEVMASRDLYKLYHTCNAFQCVCVCMSILGHTQKLFIVTVLFRGTDLEMRVGLKHTTLCFPGRALFLLPGQLSRQCVFVDAQK